MSKRTAWTRDQLLIALRLYMRSPFGKLHSRNPDIRDIAAKIGRTPSAVAMKACNFASLDPAFRASRRKGLAGASDADRAIWNEFSDNPERVAAEAEAAFARIQPSVPIDDSEFSRTPTGETDIERVVHARRVQSFFRAAVLTSYEERCAVTGLALPEILVASHIIPWSVSIERRADPANGICLNALFDRAFDRGLMTLDKQYRVVVSEELQAAAATADLECSLRDAHGRRIRLPKRFAPDPAALAYHRDYVFVG